MQVYVDKFRNLNHLEHQLEDMERVEQENLKVRESPHPPTRTHAYTTPPPATRPKNMPFRDGGGGGSYKIIIGMLQHVCLHAKPSKRARAD